jgi:hypothetical protein
MHSILLPMNKPTCGVKIVASKSDKTNEQTGKIDCFECFNFFLK